MSDEKKAGVEEAGMPGEIAGSTPKKKRPWIYYIVAAVLVFYSFAQSKRGIYLLALYPALATLAAVYLYDAIRGDGRLMDGTFWVQPGIRAGSATWNVL